VPTVNESASVMGSVDRSLADMAAAVAADSDPPPDPHSTPVGTWLERFAVEGEQKSSTLHFTPDGRVFIIAGPPHGGAGAGTWRATGPQRFSYRVAERILDPSGNFIGWVDIDHDAVQSGYTFASTGTSTIYDTDDRVVTRVAMTGEGSRIKPNQETP
jgi:hypothetical protein